MSIGQTVIEGQLIKQLVRIAPNDIPYVASSGVTYHPQDEGDSGDVAYYEINNQGDTIDFDLDAYTEGFDSLAIKIQTVWGSTDFDLLQRDSDSTIISDDSGYHSDVWFAFIGGLKPHLRLTNFDDTQAAIYPYVWVFNMQSDEN